MALAAPYTESGDAGELPGTAQAVPAGTDSISGSLSAPGEIDMYRLVFTTTTTVTFYAGNSPSIDDTLILFDGSGSPLWGDDDGAGVGTDSQFTYVFAPGTYYLAYGDFLTAAENAVSTQICTATSGDCSGTGEVLDHWANTGIDTGPYEITLSAPTSAAIPTLSEWGLILMFALLAGSMAYTTWRKGEQRI